ncbi:hypothetical protein LTR85_012222 [Meristemomyces frigidus]|nr:hypothetical protein LTR85_012222 [Meristemomyces frigidus]
MALIPLVAAAISITILYQFILYPLFLSPVAGIPAVHPLAKISSLYMLWIRFWDDENDTVFAAHQKHGEVIRLGPDELSVNCVDDGIKTIYGKNFDRHYFYRVYEDCGRENLSSSLDALSHTIRKRRITHVYSKSYLQSSPAVTGLMDRVIRHRFLSLVAGYARDQRSFDTMTLLSALALDLVTGYTFGVKNGTDFLNNSKEHAKCIGQIHTGRPYPMMFWLHEFPETVSFLERIGVLSKERYESLEALHVFCLNMCHRTETALADSSAEETAPEDYPTVYQQFKRSLDKEGLSATPSVEKYSKLSGHKPITCSPQQLEIAAEVGDQIHASDETLSITLSYAIWELSRNPEMQKRLRQECQGLGPDVDTGSTAALPSASHVDALLLLHAVIMETLRVHPVVAGGQARVTPHNKLSRLGRYENIPGGCRVQSYARFLHHNADVFPDPLAWYPERWLQSSGEPDSPEPDQKMRWFWSFSSGGRMCLGSNFALLAMKYALILMYSKYETYIVNDDGIEHMKGYVGGPTSGKLLVGARPVAGVAM